MLQLRIDSDTGLLREIERIEESRDVVLAVISGVARTELRQPLLATEITQLAQIEILDPPARRGDAIDRLLFAAIGELGTIGDIGRAGDFVFMAANEHAIARHHQIRLDEIRALLDRQSVSGKRVLRPISAGAAMRDHDRSRLRRLTHARTSR